MYQKGEKLWKWCVCGWSSLLCTKVGNKIMPTPNTKKITVPGLISLYIFCGPGINKEQWQFQAFLPTPFPRAWTDWMSQTGEAPTSTGSSSESSWESLRLGRTPQRGRGAPVGPSPAQLVPQGQQHLAPAPWPSPRPVPAHRARQPPLTCWSWHLWVTLRGIAAAVGALQDAVRVGALWNTVDRAQACSSAIPLCLGCSRCHTATDPAAKSGKCTVFVRNMCSLLFGLSGFQGSLTTKEIFSWNKK